LCRGPCLVCRGRKAARRVSGPTCVLPCHATGTPSPPRCAALQTIIPHPVRLRMSHSAAHTTRYAGAYAHLPFPTAWTVLHLAYACASPSSTHLIRHVYSRLGGCHSFAPPPVPTLVP
jgi:hypothetical protein